MANIYINKKTNRWYVKNYVAGINHTITRDENGNFFLTKKDAQNYVFTNFEMLKSQSSEGSKKCNYFYKPYLLNLERNSKMSYYESEYYLFNSQIAPFFEKIALSKLDNQKLINFCDCVNKIDSSYRYKSRILTRVKDFLEFLQFYMANKLDFSYLHLDPNLCKKTRILNYYDLEEFKRFYNALDSPQYQLMFLLFFNYGLRLSELRALQVKDFNTKDNILTIDKAVNSKNQTHTTKLVSPKTLSSIRTYPLNKGLIELLKKAVEFNNPSAFIFTSAKNLTDAKNLNKIISETQIRRINKKTAQKANLNRIRIHDFRHSCAIYIVKQGFDFTRVTSWLGHSNPSTTANYYLKYCDRNKKEIADLMEITVNEKIK